LALNRSATKNFVETHEIAVLKADKTHGAPEADALLRKLGNESGSIPFYAIFPGGGSNDEIITLDGIYTSPTPIVDALKQAVSPPPAASS
jgi:hypothetical protein